MKQILGVTNHDNGFTHRISHAEFDMSTSTASITSLTDGGTFPFPYFNRPDGICNLCQSTSPFGYKTLSIEPSSSHGIYFQLAEGEPGLDRGRLLDQIKMEPSLAGFQPNPEKPAVLVFHNLSFVSGLYSTLIALKSLLDFYSKLIARLLVPTASVFGFSRGAYGNRQISGGKLLRWIEASAPKSFGNRDILVSALLAHIDQWVGKAVSYRDSVVHYGSIKGMTEVVARLDREPHQLRQSDLVLPMMPDGIPVTDYCEYLVNSCRSLLGETLLLMPEIDFQLLSLDR